MKIHDINKNLLIDSTRMGKDKDSCPLVTKDTVTLNGNVISTKSNLTSVVNEIFKSRQIVWSWGQKKNSSIQKAIIATLEGDLLSGTYCDLRKISKKDGTVIWEKDVYIKSRNLSTSPAVIAHDGSYLIGTTDGTLFSLDPDSGRELWSYKTGSYNTKPMQAPDGTIFVQKNRDIAGVRPDGTEKFCTPIGLDRLEISYIDTSGIAFVNSFYEIIAIDSDGKKLWQVPGRSITGFAEDCDHVFATDCKELPHPVHKNSTITHTLVNARDPKTGEKLWEKEYDYARIAGYHKGKLYIYEHNNISALDAGTGKVLWEYPGNQMRQARLVLSDGTLILSTPGWIEAIDGKTGSQKWSIAAKSLNSDPPAYETSEGKVLINDRNTIYSIDPAKGNVEFRFKMEQEINRIILTSDESLVIVQEVGTGTFHAVDFRPVSAIAEKIIENNTSPEERPGSIHIEDDFVNIDGVKIPREKRKREHSSLRSQLE